MVCCGDALKIANHTGQVEFEPEVDIDLGAEVAGAEEHPFDALVSALSASEGVTYFDGAPRDDARSVRSQSQRSTGSRRTVGDRGDRGGKLSTVREQREDDASSVAVTSVVGRAVSTRGASISFQPSRAGDDDQDHDRGVEMSSPSESGAGTDQVLAGILSWAATDPPVAPHRPLPAPGRVTSSGSSVNGDGASAALGPRSKAGGAGTARSVAFSSAVSGAGGSDARSRGGPGPAGGSRVGEETAPVAGPAAGRPLASAVLPPSVPGYVPPKPVLQGGLGSALTPGQGHGQGVSTGTAAARGSGAGAGAGAGAGTVGPAVAGGAGAPAAAVAGASAASRATAPRPTLRTIGEEEAEDQALGPSQIPPYLRGRQVRAEQWVGVTRGYRPPSSIQQGVCVCCK